MVNRLALLVTFRLSPRNRVEWPWYRTWIRSELADLQDGSRLPKLDIIAMLSKIFLHQGGMACQTEMLPTLMSRKSYGVE